MSHFHHAIVWINHQEAKVYRFGASDASEVQVHTHTSLQRLHHRQGGWEAGGNPPQDSEFFRRVAGTLDGAADILVMGPGNAKLAFKTYMEHLRPDDASQVSTVETTDYPGDETLLALGRAHFFAHDVSAPPPGARNQPAM
jgi:stalled ribosome rescue protein Dom34